MKAESLPWLPDREEEEMFRADGRAWLLQFNNRCQVVCGAIAKCGPDEVRASLRELLETAVPPLGDPEALLVCGILMRCVAGLKPLLPAHEVAALLDIIATEKQLDAMFLALHSQANALPSDNRLTGKRKQPASLTPRTQEALDFVARCLGDSSLSLRALASHLQVSPGYCTKILRRETGHGFQYHLHRARVDMAKILLQGSRLSIKEITYRVGYRSTTQLDRHFMTICATTPSTYRRLASHATPADMVSSLLGEQ